MEVITMWVGKWVKTKDSLVPSSVGAGYLIFVIPIRSGYFKTLKRITRFHERTGKDLVVVGKYLIFFQRKI
jgi:hypothetical protein